MEITSDNNEIVRQFTGKRVAACPHMTAESSEVGGMAITTLNDGFLLPFKQPEKVKMLNGMEVEADALAICRECMRPDRDFFSEHWVALLAQFVGKTDMLN